MNDYELTLEIRNWRRHQHYRDRDPPWIKLYTALPYDHNWSELAPARRALLVALWIERAQQDRAPGQNTTLLRISGAKFNAKHGLRSKMLDYEALNHAGWIVIRASTTLASRRARAEKSKTNQGQEQEQELQVLKRQNLLLRPSELHYDSEEEITT
jgi:hypothetical protein